MNEIGIMHLTSGSENSCAIRSSARPQVHLKASHRRATHKLKRKSADRKGRIKYRSSYSCRHDRARTAWRVETAVTKIRGELSRARMWASVGQGRRAIPDAVRSHRRYAKKRTNRSEDRRSGQRSRAWRRLFQQRCLET